jgi:hypothetical protein
VLARALTGCGVAACLALSGALPGTATVPAQAAARPARPAYTTVDGWLTSVSVVSASDVWAVGTGGLGVALIMHWNGTRWSADSNLPYCCVLAGVAALSANDVWAVGGSLALHWNGKSWARVPVPKGTGSLNAVAATSPGDVWAVGSGSNQPLVDHWNGRQWTVQHLPSVPGGGGLSGVAARTAHDVWVVGSVGAQTLIEHWNGAKWTRIASPGLPGASASSLASVTATGADYAWAVGSAAMPDGTTRTLTMLWNGRHWQQINSPNPVVDDSLTGVTASWTHNIWAVGNNNPTTCTGDGCAPNVTLIMHWNGTRWKVVPSPYGGSDNYNTLYGIAAVTRTNIWAVGWAIPQTLILHWNGHAWS